MPIGSAQHANQILDNGFDSYSSLKVGLLTTLPIGSVSTAVEATGGNYDRESLGAYPMFSSAGSAKKSNIRVITFPDPTVNWGLITGWALLDATGTDTLGVFDDTCVVYWQRLRTPISAIPTNIITFNVGDLSISLKVG